MKLPEMMFLPMQDLFQVLIFKLPVKLAQMFRIEKDTLGEKEIPLDALYGIHALRAKENFPGIHHFPSNGIRQLV